MFFRSKGRMDAENRWWVTELLAADCEKAWIHPGWVDTMQKWYDRLEKLKKEDEKEKMEQLHQQKVKQMIKSAERRAALLHKITKDTMHSCWTVVKQRGKNGQNIGSVMRACRTWRTCFDKVRN